ncbi:MAG: hypothetical protein LAO05_09485 [Acidobacteriia bacterium]|nr:hypothetical protein [Terriglobia bacterium]
MRSEAADLHRREVLRAARRSARSAVKPERLLAFLSETSALLGGRASLPRPQPGTGDHYLL